LIAHGSQPKGSLTESLPPRQPEKIDRGANFG